MCTEWGVLSVARFCYVFQCELRGPAWAVGSYSISQHPEELPKNIIFKTLQQIGRPSLNVLLQHFKSLYYITYLLLYKPW